MSDVIIYTTDDGVAKIDLRLEDGTVWLSQLQIAELFQTTKQNVSKHIQTIYDDNELDEKATVNQKLTVQKEGEREVSRSITLETVEKEYLKTIAGLDRQAKKESHRNGGKA